MEIRTRVNFARRSAVLSYVTTRSTGEPCLDFAVIRQSKPIALSGGSKMAVEADKVANGNAGCKPCSCWQVFTGCKESTRPDQVAEYALALLKQ